MRNFITIYGISVSWVCCHKVPRTKWLRAMAMYCVTDMEVTSVNEGMCTAIFSLKWLGRNRLHASCLVSSRCINTWLVNSHLLPVSTSSSSMYVHSNFPVL